MSGPIDSSVNVWPTLPLATLGGSSTNVLNLAHPRHAPTVVLGRITFVSVTRSTPAPIAGFPSIVKSLEPGTTSSPPMAWLLGWDGMGLGVSDKIGGVMLHP